MSTTAIPPLPDTTPASTARAVPAQGSLTAAGAPPTAGAVPAAAAPVAAALPGADDILHAITSVVAEIPPDADPHSPFDEAGLDSLALVEAAVVATRLYGVRVEEWELREAGTLARAAAAIREKIAAQP